MVQTGGEPRLSITCSLTIAALSAESTSLQAV